MTIVESIKEFAEAMGVENLEGETKAEALSNLAKALKEQQSEEETGTD